MGNFFTFVATKWKKEGEKEKEKKKKEEGEKRREEKGEKQGGQRRALSSWCSTNKALLGFKVHKPEMPESEVPGEWLPEQFCKVERQLCLLVSLAPGLWSSWLAHCQLPPPLCCLAAQMLLFKERSRVRLELHCLPLRHKPAACCLPPGTALSAAPLGPEMAGKEALVRSSAAESS